MKIKERERACFSLLKKLPTDKYILIGGYAASAYDFPRFSVDLDIAVKRSDLGFFTGLLKQQKYKLTVRSDEFSQTYRGEFLRFEKRVDGLSVSVDLLVDMVQSRQTNTSYSFNYLFKNSELREVVGSSFDLAVRARVVNREMLIALKVNSMRLADQRDIIVLCEGKVNIGRLVGHLKRCPKHIIASNIESLLRTIESPQYKDSIKGVFALPERVYERVIDRTQRVFEELKAKFDS